MLSATEVFHTGFVVADIEQGMAEMSRAFDVSWTPVEERELPLLGPAGPLRPRLRFAYTREGPPRLELLEAVPGTVWELPPEGVGGTLATHHVGVWCDDLASMSRELEATGSPRLVTYQSRSGDAAGFAYHRLRSGPLIELVDGARRADFEAWFAGGPFPSGD